MFRKSASQKLSPNKVAVSDSRWMTVESAASYLSVHAQTIRRLIRSGGLQASSVRSLYRIDRTDLDNLLLRSKKFFGPYRRGTKPWVAKRHAENRGGAR